MQHKTQIDTRIAAGFLTRSFRSDETIAVVFRRVSPATIAQRLVTVERALQPRYLAWLAHENTAGANVYFAANPLVSGSRKRTKESVAGVRHLYLDLDTDGGAKLAALRTSNTVPTPTAIVCTSPGKYQVLWRVGSFRFEQQESLLKVLAFTFGGDPACTDLNRVLRLPGFLNQKYTPAPLVTVEYLNESTSHFNDFQLNDPASFRERFRGLIGPAKPTGKHSQFRTRLGMDSCGISQGSGPGQAHSNAGRTACGQVRSHVLRATNSGRRVGLDVAHEWASHCRCRHNAPGSPPLPDSRQALLCPCA